MKYSLMLSAFFFLLLGCEKESKEVPFYTFDDFLDQTFEMQEIGRITAAGVKPLRHVTFILFLSDEEFVLADAVTLGLHFFSTDGNHLYSMGSQGNGPGEFLRFGRLGNKGSDSFFVFDNRSYRVSFYARNDDGKWAFSHSNAFKGTSEDGYDQTIIRWLDNKNAYLTLLTYPISGKMKGEEEDYIYRLIDEAGETVNHEFARHAPPHMIILRYPDGGSVGIRQVPYLRRAVSSFKDDHFYIAPWNEHLSITKFSMDGDSIGGISIPYSNIKITDDDLAGYLPSQLNAFGSDLPETKPAFRTFSVSDRGNYWVNLGSNTDGNAVWAVFDPMGEYLGTTYLPSGHSILGMRNGVLYLGGTEDEVQLVMYTSPF